MKFEIERSLLIKALSLVLFISGILLFSGSASELEGYRLLVALVAALLLSASFAYLKFDSEIAFFSGASLGSAQGFAYGFVIGMLSLYFAQFFKNRFFSHDGETRAGSTNTAGLLLSYTLSYAGSYPLLLDRMTPLFFLIQPFLNLALYFYLQRALNLSSSRQNERMVFQSPFLIAAPVSSYAIAYELWALPVVPILLVAAARASTERFFFFDRCEFVFSQAEYISTDVYGDTGFLSSAESLSKALENETRKALLSNKLYRTIVLSSLLWIPFGKPLFRKPENLNQEEYEILRSNLITLKRLLENCQADPEIVEGVYRIYENYDGTGIPDGLEGDDIPLLSRYSRVLERYLLLTSWRDKEEPLSDEEAFREIESFAGTIFDPVAIRDLKRIVLPEVEEPVKEIEAEAIDSSKSEDEEQDKGNEEGQ